jgi:uncharacterized protein YecT (DUF1311 family)
MSEGGTGHVIILAALIGIAVAAILPLRAQSEPPLDCKSPSNTYEINMCAGEVFTKADKALNAIYRQLYAKYDADNKKRLQTAQRSWLKFIDDECAYETAGTIGGTIHSTMVTKCDTELTLDRIKRLKQQADCEEGDLSCNHP